MSEDTRPGPLERAHSNELVELLDRLEVVPWTPSADSAPAPSSSAVLAALSTAGIASPHLQQAFRAAADASSGLRVIFPADIQQMLKRGSASLMVTDTGRMATAVAKDGKILAHGRVVDAGVKASTAGIAAAALPVLVATAASTAQQQQLEKALASIQASVDRIEQRMKDTEHGICQSADRFVELVRSVRQSDVAAPYLHLELAQHRQAVSSLHDARHLYVERFLGRLEHQQNEHESKRGDVHPWVKLVADESEDDRLIEELSLYVRSLVLKTKLDIIAAAVLVEEGAATAAYELVHQSSIELRERFWNLQRRLRPLAQFAPPERIWARLPMVGDKTKRAHASISALVDRLTAEVLPAIPEREQLERIELTLDSATVYEVTSRITERE